MSRIAKVITGGQAGADQGALRAAKAAGIPTGGYAPKGWLTEDGGAPWLADYGLIELTFTDYPRRTRAVVLDATSCIWFGNPNSAGGKLTERLCRARWLPIYFTELNDHPEHIADWLQRLIDNEGEQVLLVAGNRESKRPGIGSRVEDSMAQVFALLGSFQGGRDAEV